MLRPQDFIIQLHRSSATPRNFGEIRSMGLVYGLGLWACSTIWGFAQPRGEGGGRLVRGGGGVKEEQGMGCTELIAVRVRGYGCVCVCGAIPYIMRAT
jgi:hypothetical protein